MADNKGMETASHSHSQGKGFQYTIWMFLDSAEHKAPHYIPRGEYRLGSLCGKLGPQNPFSPDEFYTIHASGNICAGCRAVLEAEKVLTSVKADGIMAS
jgi:hypothetical protein